MMSAFHQEKYPKLIFKVSHLNLKSGIETYGRNRKLYASVK